MNRHRIGKILCVICAVVMALAGCASAEPALSVDELLRLGENFLLEMEYEQALAPFLGAIAIDPKNVEAYLGAAQAYWELGQLEDAADILERGYDETQSPLILQMLEDLEDDIWMRENGDFDSDSDGNPPSENPIVGPAPFEDALRQAYLAGDTRTVAQYAMDEDVLNFMLGQVEEPSSNYPYEYIFEVGNGEWMLVRGHYSTIADPYYGIDIYVLNSMEEKLYYDYASGSSLSGYARYEKTSFLRPLNQHEHPDMVWNGECFTEQYNFETNFYGTDHETYVNGVKHGETIQTWYEEGKEPQVHITRYDHGEIIPNS